jgi:hypothetical protein
MVMSCDVTYTGSHIKPEEYLARKISKSAANFPVLQSAVPVPVLLESTVVPGKCRLLAFR